MPALEAVKRFMAGADHVQIGDELVLIEQVVAMFFRHLKQQAARVAGVDIDSVVVTVPANSRGIARHRTKLCAQLAELNVLTLINEPTAAAMAATARMAHDGRVLVVDWGGGTLDVTALESRSGVFIEQASSGVPQLGGKDFDSRFAAAILKSVPDHQWSAGQRRQFTLEIERAKIRLSSQDFTNVALPNGASQRVTREQFDEACRPLVERLRRPIEQCLEDARWSLDDVDHVLLVGGTCRIPAVRSLVDEVLRRPPTAGIDPMTAIAEGAAVAAAIMTGELADNDFFVSTEHALGTAAVDGSDMQLKFSEIIARGHKLPATGRDQYSPVHPEQETVNVQVLEGDPKLPLDHELNVVIAEWEIELPDPSRNDPRSFTLEYRYDVEGILHVKATDDLTGDLLLEETVGSQATKDKRDLVRISQSAKESVDAGTLRASSVSLPDDPATAQLINNVRNKIVPFVDDDEANGLRALLRKLEEATTPAERAAASEPLKQVLNKYSYLL